MVRSYKSACTYRLMRSSVPRISPAFIAPLLSTTPFPPVALTISLAPAIQFLLLILAPPAGPIPTGSSCLTMPRMMISIRIPARKMVLTSPRLSGKGRRGERDGSMVMRDGEKAEGAERERQTCEKALADVGMTESRFKLGGSSSAVPFVYARSCISHRGPGSGMERYSRIHSTL
jgi:hypothetical protein